MKEAINTNNKIVELIGRRRRQILVHSYIYYKLDKNLIEDTQWSKWALELYNLQIKYPKESQAAPLYDEFVGFDYSTGSDLPLDADWIKQDAEMLLHYNLR